jgi:ADP-L-glycero-D-manno-heptose 6-epimerase
VQRILVTGGAGFIGSNLTLALQERYPDAEITVVDDFRSGDFRNLRGFRGDFVAADISRLDWHDRFRDGFDVIFHQASITDTTEPNQLLQAHDNIEGFRRLLAYAAGTHTRVIYASSAATYGLTTGANREDQPPAPENIYAFSKVQLDLLAARHAKMHSAWKIVGLRYFNVYGPREGHKKAAASMVYQLYLQMKAGRRPRVFQFGEQRRDFVYVKDVIAMALAAVNAAQSGVFNCGSGQAISFNDLIAELNRNLGTSLEPEYFENPYSFYQPHTEADMAKARKELNFTPQYPPARGIADYVGVLEQKLA